ncbi:hypothetical protein ACIOHR_30390 [Streptomyces anulatus]
MRQLPRRQRWIYTVLVTVVLGLLGGTLSYFIPFALDQIAAETTTRTQKEAEEKVDLEDPPFTATIRYETYDESNVPSSWNIVLDRTLTPDEQNELIKIERGDGLYFNQVWKLLKPLGARVLPFPPGDYTGNSFAAGVRGFYLNLHSDRNAGLSITDMKARIERCFPSSVRTVVTQPPEGLSSVPGVLWQLAGKGPTPLIVDEGDQHRGEPFFRYNQIDLGGGSAPGSLRIQSAVAGRSCLWRIEVQYTDSAGEHLVTIGDGKNPILTESMPTNPSQAFSLSSASVPGFGPWRCFGEIAIKNCRHPSNGDMLWRRGTP